MPSHTELYTIIATELGGKVFTVSYVVRTHLEQVPTSVFAL